MALTLQEVQGLMDTLEQRLTVRINGFLLGEGQPIKDAIDAHGEIIQQRAYTVDHEQRMNAILTPFNSTTADTVAEVSRQQLKLAEQQGQASQALNETQMLDRRLKELTVSIEKLARTGTPWSSRCRPRRTSSGPTRSSI